MGIPVVKHQDEEIFVPTLIFGQFFTSSNYNDEEEKVTGGRNGFGAKLCNVFSSLFAVETASKDYGLKFQQVIFSIPFAENRIYRVTHSFFNFLSRGLIT